MKFGCLFLVLALAACESGPPINTDFDNSAGTATCEILGDGFVRTGNRRIPLELFVLEQRQAVRKLSKEERLKYTVAWRIKSDLPNEEAARIASDGNNYLLLQLQIMGVRQAGL